MTPATLSKANEEHSHQRALFAFLNIAGRFGFAAAWDEQCYTVAKYAETTYGRSDRFAFLLRAFAIPNGGQRDKITAGKLKAEGVKKGVPDIMLPKPFPDRRYCGLYVEMKRPGSVKAGARKSAVIDQRAGSTSGEQDEWIAYLRKAGYAVSVCFDWIAAAKEVQSYAECCTA